jgi:hypothetical protein
MQTFLVLYRGDTTATAQPVVASTDPALIREAAYTILNALLEKYMGLDLRGETVDAVQLALDSGKAQALEAIILQAGAAEDAS